VNNLIVAFVTVLFFCINDALGNSLEQNDSMRMVQKADTANQQQDMNNPENTLPAGAQQKSQQSINFEQKPDSPVSAHKVNYFSINQLPGNNNAQIKFQISMKVQVLEPNLYVLKYDIFPAYVSYSQKSLWNVGQKSQPFEESNYNPEFFLDYSVNFAILNRFKLGSIVISPIEHESNGLAGIQSRSWNRQYVLIRFVLESKEKLEITNSFLPDKALLYVKFWYASSYSDEDTYLQSIGNNNKFLDYMGYGEIGISVRNFLWGGSLKDHQLDLKTLIFQNVNKYSYEFEFRQQLPNINFALYMQYWYGYGETLLRFDQFGHRGFVGLSFSY
jgi:phospholipase A1